MKREIPFIVGIIACLCLCACASNDPRASESSENPPSSSQATDLLDEAEESRDVAPKEELESSLQIPLDLLCTELWERGIADYRNWKVLPYNDIINGCVSYGEEIPVKDLLVFQFFEDPDLNPGYYMVAAITKDHQNFFQMSHVDGILYDIREEPAYIHEGEHRIEEAQHELESFLDMETDMDPKQYQIQSGAKRVNEEDLYYFVFDRKETENQNEQPLEFYVSKDLKQIVKIDYADGPVENLHYIGQIEFRSDYEKKDIYTIVETEEIFEQWLNYAEPLEHIVQKEETKIGKGVVYRFRTLSEDGTSNLYEIPADFSYPYKYEIIEETGKIAQYNYLRN